MANEWTELVKKTWNKNKGKSGYQFKDALKDAKKCYGGVNKTSKMKKSKKGTRKNRKH